MDEPNWTKALLETPSGFALFYVKEDALKEIDDIWVYFRNVHTAMKAMIPLGFVQFADKSVAWDGETQSSKDLIRLIQKSCKGTKDLFVESVGLQAVIEQKLNVKCSYKDSVVDELIWGMKNVLHGFIVQEANNINREYCLPLSKGLQKFLQFHLINVSPEMLGREFIHYIGLLRYFDTTLEEVPKTLRESFDEHICRIGESIENDLDYARVLASILVPELAPQYDFFKMFSSDLARKIQEADKHATEYRDKKLTMKEREIIMGGLGHLLAVPKHRNEIMTHVKRIESEHTAKILKLKGYTEAIRKPAYLEHSTFRRTLIETPSGFAIFDVKEDVFRRPRHIWTWFSNERDACQVVFALGFVRIHDKSIVRDSCHGPGQDLSRLIRTLCSHGAKLIVQDNDLKSVIEDKLKVRCFTQFSNDDDSLGDLMWGLKRVVHEFIPQERGNLNEDYYLPMSKGLQNALLSHGVSVSQGQVDTDFLYVLGYLEILDWSLLVAPLAFRRSFSHLVSPIGKLIKDHVQYAKVIAHILFPELQEFDLKLLSNDLREQVAEVAIKVKQSGKSISEHDKQVILAFSGYLSDVHEKKDCCLRYLKSKDSKKELPRNLGAYDDIVDPWLMSWTKPSGEKRLMVDYEGRGDIEEIKAPKKATQEASNTFPEAENTSKEGADNVKTQQQPYPISEAADHLANFKGTDNAYQQHYPSTGDKENKDQNADNTNATASPASKAKVNDTKAASKDQNEFKIVVENGNLNEFSNNSTKGAGKNEVTGDQNEGAGENYVDNSKGAGEKVTIFFTKNNKVIGVQIIEGGRGSVTLQDLMDRDDNDTKRKEGIKRRSSSKDNLSISLNPGSGRHVDIGLERMLLRF